MKPPSSNLFKWWDDRFSPISPDDSPVGKVADPINPIDLSAAKPLDSFTRTTTLHSNNKSPLTFAQTTAVHSKPRGPPAPALVVKPGTGRVAPLGVDVQEELSQEIHQLRQQLGGQGEVSVRLPHQTFVTPIPSDVGKGNSGYLTVCRTWGPGHQCVQNVEGATGRPAKTFSTPSSHVRAPATPVNHRTHSLRNLNSKSKGRTVVRRTRVKARGRTTPHTTTASTTTPRVRSRVLSVKEIPHPGEGPVPIFFPPSRRRDDDITLSSTALPIPTGNRHRKSRGHFPNFPAAAGALRVEETSTVEELSSPELSISSSSTETILGMVLGLLTVLTLILILVFLIRRQRGKLVQDVEPEGPKVAVTINLGRPDPGGEDDVNEQELNRLEAERRAGHVRKETMLLDRLQWNAMPDPLLGSQQEVALESGDLIRVSQGQQEVTVERIDRV